MENTTTYNRAKLWQIGLFALNNTATNVMLFFMMFVSYYLNGIAGIAVVTVGFLLTAMRIFDGFTDPIIGFIIDRTDTKFGKFRPMMVLGYVIMLIAILILFNTLHLVPEAIRIVYFVLIYGIYVIGYTFQTACTKAAQPCLTNDPKQRPLFSLFDGIYNTILFAAGAWIVSNVLVPKHQGFTQGLFSEFSAMALIASAVLTVCAIIGIAKKDRKELFGLGVGKTPKVKFSDYVDVIKNNRGIQMLIVAASTDKLSLTTMGNAVVAVIIFGIVGGNYAAFGELSVWTTIPTFVLLFFGVAYARKMGQKQALVLATWLSIACAVGLGALILFGDMTSLSFANINFFTILFAVLYVLLKGTSGVAGNIVIPMIADCADYETYRSGKYVPGMMGTLFSFVDKLISAFATTVVALICAAIGFADSFPTVDTPFSTALLYGGVFMFVGLPILGWIASLIAMKFYPLNAEKMAEIQTEIQKIKDSAE
ncbi:MAG: MFS transporter [Spirochaetales bacterium]